MQKLITYDEKELNSTLDFLIDKINSLDFEITMMEEQGINLRDNLDWKTSGMNLRIALEQFKEGICFFNQRDIKNVQLNRYNYKEWLEKVKENYYKEIKEREDLCDSL